jgi:hypothetical protein
MGMLAQRETDRDSEEFQDWCQPYILPEWEVLHQGQMPRGWKPKGLQLPDAETSKQQAKGSSSKEVSFALSSEEEGGRRRYTNRRRYNLWRGD